jgi:putative GTP pyrophosphokinase
VIVYYPSDVRAVGMLIDREFEVDWENTNRQGEDDPPDRFGYRSDHYIVRLPAREGWERFSGLRAEIQVRTVMQHAWAAVDHRIRYKAGDLPRDLTRRLFRLSALLELADEQFAGLQLASHERSIQYAQALDHGDLAVAVDILSLRVLLDREDVGMRWARRAVALGYDWVDPVESAGDDVVRLLHIVRRLGATRVGDVVALLPEDPEVGDDLLRDVLAGLHSRPGQATFWAFPGDVLALVILGLRGTRELILESDFRPEIQEVLLRRL